MLPQMTRTVKLADELSTRLATPIDQVVPGLTGSPRRSNSPGAARRCPTDLGQFIDVINDLSGGMSPLAQIAEQAGGLFGAAHPRAVTRAGARSAPRRAPTAPPLAPPPPPPSTPTAGQEGRRPRSAPAKKAAGRRRRRRRSGRAPRKKRRPARRPADAAARQRADERGRHDRAGQRGAADVDGDRRALADARAGGRPRAMPWPSTGEKLPLVTTPTRRRRRARRTRRAAGGGPRWRCRRGGGRRPRRARRASAARPRNSGLPHATTQPSPACSGVMPGPELVAVQRQPGLQAQRVAGAEAGRHDAGADDRRPQVGGGRRPGTAISTPRSPV